MPDQTTCGEGLVEHSVLPAKLGELTAALAENLEVHLTALDPEDEGAGEERDAYLSLAKQHRKIATELKETGEEMAGYRDLPMGRHDPDVMSSAKPVEAFANFVRVEQELLALLETRLEQDQNMLVAMRASAPT